MNLSKYNKFWYALLSAIIAAAGSLSLGASTDGGISIQEWLMSLTLFISPFVVLVAPKNAEDQYSGPSKIRTLGEEK